MTPEKGLEKRTRRSFTKEQIVSGLLELATCNGNPRQAAANLAERGFEIHHSVLWRWKAQQYPEEYERVCAEVLPKVQVRAAQQYMDASERMQEVAAQITASMNIADIPERDKPAAARNMTVAAATATDKGLLLTGQPTQVVQHRSATELLRALKAKGFPVAPEVIDSTATEEDDESA